MPESGEHGQMSAHTEMYLEQLKQRAPERLEEFVRLQRLGDYLREKREGQGMSGREVARKLGISPNVVSEIETGKKSYPDRIYERFADAVHADQDEVFEIIGRTPLYLRRFFDESPGLQAIARLVLDLPDREDLLQKALDAVSHRVEDARR
ncbi:MAG: helix-turn-helix domain-containing protein [Firmicutes bacterium]|jgi:transcriptional regulator with XRE-family HTH domain|nr:helix-turn-helix domain-containing protein [Bacillota bacterium]